MKVRLKRVKHTPGYNYDRIDIQFMDGSIDNIPNIGKSLFFQYNRPDLGTWITTPIIERTLTKTIVVLKTRNSTYHLKMGWKEDEKANYTR